jgi:hypothetical protein
MAHTYLLFDFGTDEQKAQLARHKLEGWKQAFRLDKKLQYKLEREEDETKAGTEQSAKPAEPPKAEKTKSKAAKSKTKQKSKETEASEEAPASNGKVNLLVRTALARPHSFRGALQGSLPARRAPGRRPV